MKRILISMMSCFLISTVFAQGPEPLAPNAPGQGLNSPDETPLIDQSHEPKGAFDGHVTSTGKKVEKTSRKDKKSDIKKTHIKKGPKVENP